MSGGKASAQKSTLAERRQKAFSLRKSGASYRAIARTIATDESYEFPKYNEGQAYKDVAYVLKELATKTTHDAEAYRQLELERLDTALIAIARHVQAGDLYAIDRWLKISESRRKLLGLDAPIQIEVQERVDAELNAFLGQIESLLPPDLFKQVLQATATIQDRSAVASKN